VLWGKGDDDSDETVAVKKVVSFGTASQPVGRLVGVGLSQWKRPQEDAESWLIPLPYCHFLFKVSKSKPTAGERVEYALDDVRDKGIEDLVVDLHRLGRIQEPN